MRPLVNRLTQPRIALLSPEPWDNVWRRNQHLAAQLTRQDLVAGLTFIAPPLGARETVFEPEAGIRVVSPPRLIPARLGGLRAVARWLQRRWLGEIDLLWINHAALGQWLLGAAPAWYDVTDDWRVARLGDAAVRRQVAAEDVLADRVPTVVCSRELRQRWHERYGVDAVVVRNAVDLDAMRAAEPLVLKSRGPHVGYVGTLHDERLDVELLIELARSSRIGTLHLVGPDHLDGRSRRRLTEAPGLVLHPPVASAEVPSILKAMDVLVLPHAVTPFTLSLDAIKAFEYLATDRPVVATPTSGFQGMAAGSAVPGLRVAERRVFVQAVEAALDGGAIREMRTVPHWGERARELAASVWGG
jgi:teichuronic acid biosynthesis glycosyltransferase TuaH